MGCCRRYCHACHPVIGARSSLPVQDSLAVERVGQRACPGAGSLQTETVFLVDVVLVIPGLPGRANRTCTTGDYRNLSLHRILLLTVVSVFSALLNIAMKKIGIESTFLLLKRT